MSALPEKRSRDASDANDVAVRKIQVKDVSVI